MNRRQRIAAERPAIEATDTQDPRLRLVECISGVHVSSIVSLNTGLE